MNNYNTGQQTNIPDHTSSFFQESSEVWNELEQQQQEIPMHAILHSERGIAGFVSKLYQCLQSNDSNPKYVRWCKHNGKDMFMIDCIPEFTEAVLPRLFKHCKFPSFVRQLNIYGFQRDTDARKTKDTKNKVSCRWYHPYFRPNRRDLFHLIRRKATRYTRKKRVKPAAEEDPETILSADEDEETSLVKEEEVEEEEEDQDEQEDPDEQDEQDDQPNNILFHQGHEHHVLFKQEEQDYSNVIKAEEQPHDNILAYQPNEQPSTNTMLFQQQPKENLLFHQNSELSFEHLTTSQLQPTTTTTTTTNDSYAIKQDDPYTRIQQLELELYQLKLKYGKMEGYLTKELSCAKQQIKERQHHIHQLECALGITKQQTTNGYMNTIYYNNSFNNNIMYTPVPNTNYVLKPEQQQQQQQQQNTSTAGSTFNMDFDFSHSLI